MTILIGILCDGGIVIGSDSAATLSAGNIRTIEEHTSNKIQLIDDHAIVATTGSIGFSQRFHNVLKNYHTERGFSQKSHIESGKKLSAKMLEDLSETNMLREPLGFGALVAFSHDNKPYLLELDVNRFQPEFRDNNLWYVTMGSGQLISDPFLGLMRKIFCRDKNPGLSLGIFLTAWALNHVIHVNPGGINAPSNIAVLSLSGGKFKARFLTGDELAEHENNIHGAEDYLRGYLDILSGKDAPDIPPV